MIMTLQQVTNQRISFLGEQINDENKSGVNSSFQSQIDVIRSIDNNTEKVECIFLQKKSLFKNCKDVHESDSCLRSLTAWNGCSSNSSVFLETRKEMLTEKI